MSKGSDFLGNDRESNCTSSCAEPPAARCKCSQEVTDGRGTGPIGVYTWRKVTALGSLTDVRTGARDRGCSPPLPLHPLEIRLWENSSIYYCATQIGKSHVASHETGPSQVRFGEMSTDKHCVSEIGTGQTGSFHVRTRQMRVSKVHSRQLDGGTTGPSVGYVRRWRLNCRPKLCPPEPGVAQVQVLEVEDSLFLVKARVSSTYDRESRLYVSLHTQRLHERLEFFLGCWIWVCDALSTV